MLQGFIPVITEFYGYRAKLYDDITPPDAITDYWPSFFFAKQKVWLAENPQQKTESLNLMIAMMKGAAKQNAAAKSPELLDLIKKTGSAFEAISNTLKSKPLQDSSKVVARLPATADDETINTAISKLEQAVKGL
jgi:hypothetical protein